MAFPLMPPGTPIFGRDGLPSPGATATFYVARTETLKTVHSDFYLTNALGSTVYTDSAGFPVAADGSTQKVVIYLDDEPYKVVFHDADGVVIGTYDGQLGPLSDAAGGVSGDFLTEEQGDFRYTRFPTSYAIDSTLGNSDRFSRWSSADNAMRSMSWAQLVDAITPAILSDLKTSLLADGTVIEAGTKCVFNQTLAPTGWTKSTSHNNKALRLVSGTVGDGGTSAFTTIFTATRSISGTVGATTLTESQLAAHDHVIPMKYYGPVPAEGTGSVYPLVHPTLGIDTSTVNEATSDAGSDASHTHSLTMNTMNMDVQYVDVIIATKD